MLRILSLACLLAGCGFNPSTGDAPMSTPDVASTDTCFGTQAGYSFCVATPPTASLTLAGVIDTDTCQNGFYTMLAGSNERVCAFAGAGVSIPVLGVIATGNVPLVIASTADITIAGTLDVSTRSGTQHGAGHNPAECVGNLNGAADAGGGAGAAGASFGTAGEPGGNGGGGVIGAAAEPAQTATSLRGGCPGGSGGTGHSGANGGTAGWAAARCSWSRTARST